MIIGLKEAFKSFVHPEVYYKLEEDALKIFIISDSFTGKPVLERVAMISETIKLNLPTLSDSHEVLVEGWGNGESERIREIIGMFPLNDYRRV